jgi:hypothetical protein
MKMSHECEEPNDWVRTSLPETNPDTGVSLLLNGIGSNATVGENSFLRGKPSGGQRCVREAEEANNGNNEGNRSLEDKKPLPTSQTSRAIHTMKDPSSNQPCEGCSEYVACVEDSDTSSNLFAVVKDTEKVDSTRVVGCFCHTEEEANQKKPDKVMADSSETRYDSPQGHASTHIVARFGPGEEHVLRKVSFYTFVCLERPETYRRDLSEKVTDEENADTGKILCLWSVLILMIEIGVCDLRVGVRLRSSSKSLRRARAMAFRSK